MHIPLLVQQLAVCQGTRRETHPETICAPDGIR